MKKKIYIVGIGMGSIDGITLEGLNALKKSQSIIGAKRMLEVFNDFSCEKFASFKNDEIVKYIEESKHEIMSVAVSGDLGFYSVAKKLKEMLKEYEVESICGISSVSYFSSKIGVSWDDMKIITLHGRGHKLIGQVMTNEKTFILTGGQNKVEDICKKLVENDLGELKVAVGENLSYENERIIEGTALELADMTFDNLSVMIVFNDDALEETYVTHGVEDEEFIRARVPMTKSEIRNVALAKMKLRRDDLCWDVGAGTGSVAIEMALRATDGFVYAIEKNEAAVELIKENKRKFKTNNLKVIKGLAPDALRDLPAPDRVFIGGSSGNMEEIVSIILEKNPEVRFVVTAITLETVAETINVLKKFNIKDNDIVHMAVGKSKKIAGYNMMMGLNPVYIMTGQGASENEE